MKTGIHIILTIITIIAASVCSHAANRGYIPDFEIVGAGVKTEVSFYIQSPVEGFDGFQTEIELPESLSLSGLHSSTGYIDKYAAGFQIASRVSNNTLKVVGFATDTNKKFNSGAVFKFIIRSSGHIENKDYTITIKNTRVSKGKDEYTLDNSSTVVTVVLVAQSLILNASSLTMKAGDEFQLSARIEPWNAVDKTVIWNCTDESVATVDETGLVTAISGGVAEITAKCGDVYDYCTVIVEPRYVTSITFDITEKVAKVGDEFTITATVLPENADNKTIEWYVSDNLIATVENGNVKVHNEGDCSIMAVANDGSGVKAECRLTAVSGIEDIVVTDKDARFDIYNLNGVLLHRNAGTEDLRKLGTGCYIINNRKVYKH